MEINFEWWEAPAFKNNLYDVINIATTAPRVNNELSEKHTARFTFEADHSSSSHIRRCSDVNIFIGCCIIKESCG